MCGCLSPTPHWGPVLKPRLVAWWRIEPAALWFTGWHSIHWATSARAIIHFFKRFYLFLERGEGREKGKEGNIFVRGKQISCLFNRRPGPQPGHVPWPGIKPATFRFAGQCLTHWATSVRAVHTLITLYFNHCFSCSLPEGSHHDLPTFLLWHAV